MYSRMLFIGLLTTVHFLYGQKTFLKRNYFDSEKTKPKEVISLKKSDSTLHGPYLSFFENGSLAISGFYNHNESDSTWVFYFENGREKAIGSYSKGIQNGWWKYFYENGKPKAKGRFRQGHKHGTWTFYYENEVEKSSGLYFNDQKEGIWNYFYEEGSLKAQAYYEGGGGSYKEFYPSGKLKAEGKNENELSTGRWVYYYETGEIESVGFYQDGLRNGTWKYFHKNGALSAEVPFSDGEKSGTWKSYYPDGNLASEGDLKNNQKDGFWKLYYPSGEIKGQVMYDKGSGEFIEFYANGKQKAKGKIADDNREGKWTYYNEEGLEDGVAFFENGIGEYHGYYPDGTMKMTGKIHDDRRIGKWILYNPDGTIAGTYMPVYEEEKPIFRTIDIPEPKPRTSSTKPEYRYKNKKSRYFDPRVNEYTGYIIGTNPLWTLVGTIPVSAEYYLQERLGYEASIIIHKRPFFKNLQNVDINKTFKLGGDLILRQKFYNLDSEMGMFYFGHQIQGGYIRHGANILDSTDVSLPPKSRKIHLNETRLAYGLLIGNRWMKYAGNSGWTFDFNVGFSVGQRFVKKSYKTNPVFDQVFNSLNQERLYLPIILTLNIGYAGPKRRNTGF